jgi:hypothetical protein
MERFMLTVTAITKEDAATHYYYECNFTVTTSGDGLWGCEAGRVVNVTQIDVFEEDSYKMVNVTHDSDWNIYTDTAFELAISDALGYTVCFTEQGMQDENYASMEA